MPAASHFRHGFALYCWIHNYLIVRVKVCDDGTPHGSYNYSGQYFVGSIALFARLDI